MKITLIQPKVGHKGEDRCPEGVALEPLSLAMVASLTPPDVEVVLYDDRLEEIPYDEPTDLVAITVITFTARRSYEIAAEYRKRRVPVVVGGHHASLMPEEAKRYVDSVCIGDAEEVWPDVVRDAREGTLKPYYRGRFTDPLRDLIPRREIYSDKPYLPVTLVQFSRGCKHKCNFCTIASLYDRKYFHRRMDDIAQDLASQDRRLVLFVDDNMVMLPEVAKELYRTLAPLRLRWVSSANINMTQDPEMMRLMARSGCVGHLVGFESIEEESVRSMRKTANLAKFDQYRTQLKVMHAHGIQIWAAFTLGHEHDSPATIERTLEYSMRHKFTMVDYNVLVPYPATRLYEDLAKEGRLRFDGRWWLHPDYRFGDAPFQPRLMTTDELALGCHEAQLKFYTRRSIVWRALDFKTHMRSYPRFRIYQMCNVLSYSTCRRKQWMELGDTSEVPEPVMPSLRLAGGA